MLPRFCTTNSLTLFLPFILWFIFKAAVLSQGLYSIGLCSDCLGLGAVWQLTTALDLNVKTTPAPEPSNCEPFTVEDRYLSPHPCIACPTHLNVLINSPTIKAQAYTGYGIHCSLISKKLGLSSSMTSLPTFSSA